MRREGKSFVAPPPSQDEIAEAASRQVLDDSLFPATSYRPHVGYFDLKAPRTESANPRTSNGSAEVFERYSTLRSNRIAHFAFSPSSTSRRMASATYSGRTPYSHSA